MEVVGTSAAARSLSEIPWRIMWLFGVAPGPFSVDDVDGVGYSLLPLSRGDGVSRVLLARAYFAFGRSSWAGPGTHDANLCAP